MHHLLSDLMLPLLPLVLLAIEIISEECSTEYQQSINNNNNSDDEPHTRPGQMLLNQVLCLL